LVDLLYEVSLSLYEQQTKETVWDFPQIFHTLVDRNSGEVSLFLNSVVFLASFLIDIPAKFDRPSAATVALSVGNPRKFFRRASLIPVNFVSICFSAITRV
jgi:hypothetical protein